jgi:hypothetical protein
MKHFTVAFAGSTLTLLHATREVQEFLSLLFLDICQRSSDQKDQPQLCLRYDQAGGQYQLHQYEGS